MLSRKKLNRSWKAKAIELLKKQYGESGHLSRPLRRGQKIALKPWPQRFSGHPQTQNAKTVAIGLGVRASGLRSHLPWRCVHNKHETGKFKNLHNIGSSHFLLCAHARVCVCVSWKTICYCIGQRACFKRCSHGIKKVVRLRPTNVNTVQILEATEVSRTHVVERSKMS